MAKRRSSSRRRKPRAGSGARFRKLKGQLKRKGVRNPGGLAASIGRKKFGKKKFQKMAARGRRRKSRSRKRKRR